ncbi:hypothetical protein [uncultured Limimaricola sp.]|uniref:lysozyme inhibitor LprI family protein n=1 Tax=uncultured Limimaricola sp. TaxID=2211667 RepID=UPI0030FC2ADD
MTTATRFTLCLLALAPAMTFSTGLAQAQPSFDCGAARTATERAICADPSLAELELRMVGVYDDLAARIGETEARRIADIQLERRQACAGDSACIERQLLTSIGIFRAESRAATPPAAATDQDAETLSDLRAALGRETTTTRPETTAEDESSRAEDRAEGLESGFASLPEYRRRNVQGRLRDAGLLAGPIDGVWGRASAAAVEALLEAARERGRNFPVQRPEGADAFYRFIDSDIFYYEFLPEAAR